MSVRRDISTAHAFAAPLRHPPPLDASARLPVGTDRRGGRGKSPEVDRGWVQARLHVRIHAEVARTWAPRRSGVPRGLRTHAADVGDPGGADRARADESA